MSDNTKVASHDFTTAEIVASCENLQVVTAAYIDLNWIVKNDEDGHSLKYWAEKALIAGAKALKRSQEYAAETKRNRERAKEQDNAINNFAKYCLMNPAVLRDKDKLLEVAATFDVPVSQVLSMFKKATEASATAAA